TRAHRRTPLPRRPARPARSRPWTRLPDEQLLKVRFCDLKLSIERSSIARHVRRLERLERRIMREAEGGTSRLLLRILRHEAGHAVDNAYRLRRRKRWREVFGPASLQYPHHYTARPGSRRYVHHLGEWYAQAHPTEDFAETFAVWLKPNSDWRRSYADWPAFHKLNVVEELVSSVRGQRAPVRNKIRIEPLDLNTRTLAEHYRRKLARNHQFRRGLADDLLKRV